MFLSFFFLEYSKNLVLFALFSIQYHAHFIFVIFLYFLPRNLYMIQLVYILLYVSENKEKQNFTTNWNGKEKHTCMHYKFKNGVYSAKYMMTVRFKKKRKIALGKQKKLFMCICTKKKCKKVCCLRCHVCVIL